MIDRLESLIGREEIQAFRQSLAARPPKSVRPRVDRRDLKLPFETVPVSWYPGGRQVVNPTARPGGFLEYAAADYYIQDSGSMLPLAMLDLQPDDWVCDLCAAPGGKATAISEMLGPNGFLLANEVIASRLDVLRFALGRTGRANYCVSNLDPEPLAELFSGRFDKVLVDVPCSGQSLLGRQRQTESSFSPSHVQHCAARAKRILDNALELVRPGGRLIVSTCTFAIEENEAQIESILDAFPNQVQLLNFPSLGNWQSPLTPGCYRVWPHRDPCAGGFAAALQVTQRIGPDEQPSSHEARFAKKKKPKHGKAFKKPSASPSNLEHELEDLGSIDFRKTTSHPLWFGYEPGAAQFAEEFGHEIAEGQRLAEGVRIAQCQRDRIEPYHGLAMLIPGLFTPSQSIELDDLTAERFMLGQSLDHYQWNASGKRARTPWCVARWNGKPLGWLKAAANRWNNYLPTWARFTSFEPNST